MGRSVALVFCLVLLCSLQPSYPLAEIENEKAFFTPEISEDPPLISFDQENGMTLDQNSSFTGFIVSSSFPELSQWQMSKILQNGDLMPLNEMTNLDLVPANSSQDDGLYRWTWEFPINPSSALDCTCLVTITSTANELVSSKSIAFFTGYTNIPVVIFDATDGNEGFVPTSDQIELTGWANSQDNHPVNIRLSALKSENSANACSVPPSIISIDDPSGINFELSDNFTVSGYFAELVDSSMLDDGWYSLWKFSSLQNDSSIIQETCSVTKLDNSDPVAIIEGISESIEGSGDLIFDAGLSFDPYWGKEDLNYIWTLVRIDPTGNVLLDNVEGSELSYFTISDDYSGNFLLTLLVSDQLGSTDFTSAEFSILNQAPSARLSISGQSLSDGDSFLLPEMSEWTLDATQSMDTSNDIDGLRCVWKLNFKPLFEGCERILQWPLSDLNETLLLTLEVIDDNDEFSSITVEISRSGVSNDLPLPLIVLLISSLFFISSLVYYRRKNNTMDIPKWND